MLQFDPSQQCVFELDPARNARVLGAPGSGKTLTLIEAAARLFERPGWGEGSVLVLAANRAVAAQLRARFESRIGRAIGGAPVRTAVSYAFSVLQRSAAQTGRTPLRLLTGTAHDEAISEAVEQALAAPGADFGSLAPEAMRGQAFRAELREVSRVVDDFGLDSGQLAAALRAGLDSPAGDPELRPSDEQASQWIAALDLLARVDARLEHARPDERSSSGLMRSACAVLRGDDAPSDVGALPAPRLVLVDDAQELGEGELALLSALVSRGARVWVFGDPDIATGAFHGERTRVFASLGAELHRAGAPHGAGASTFGGVSGHLSGANAGRGPGGEAEQEVLLSTVHRHGAELRGFLRELSSRVGTAGAGRQRAAVAASEQTSASAIQFATVPTLAEQLGVLAHRLRRRHLGLDDRAPVDWSDMVVVCRSRGEVTRVARVLAGHQVPASVAAGGVVPGEHQLVRELIRLLQHALGIEPLSPREIVDLLGGTALRLDPVALRRLRGELRLQEVRRARANDEAPASVDEIIADAFAHPGDRPIVDSRGGRALLRLGKLAESARATCARGATAREVLWAIWEGTRLAEALQTEALEGRGSRADEAHRVLDAVLGLFFALQRHEEQASSTPIAELLEELLSSTVPEDSLAARSERNVVTVTTPQGTIGREYSLVCLLGPQDGAWPNLRARGSLLGVAALERWLRGEPPTTPSRRDTLHDELRLFIHACARARDELLAVAVSDEDHHPSSFFGLGRAHAVAEELPSSRLTLRGAVAEMRRRVTADPLDREALDTLVMLAREGVAGAHPGEWYGVLPPSTEAPLVDIAGDPEARVPVSPSHLETAERCPLDWAIAKLGGGSTGVSQGIGTLLHHALETADGIVTAEQIAAVVEAEWEGLRFEAAWESERKRGEVREMARGLAHYLTEFEQSNREVLGREARLQMDIGAARVTGIADRLEARRLADGRVELSVVDLKTGGTMPSARELGEHAQLQAYQLGVVRGEFELESDESDFVNGGARLLYVHPKVRTTRGPDAGSTFRQPTQPLLDAEARKLFEARVERIAEVMAAGTFVGRVEHHCSDPHSLGGACRLHIVPAVSQA